MNIVSLRNTRDFPHYKPRSALSFQGNALIKSDQWTYGEVATQWENATPSELIMLWLWHNGEIREIYRLAPMTITHAALLETSVVKTVDQDLLRAAIAGERFAELFYPHAQDQAISDYLKSLT